MGLKKLIKRVLPARLFIKLRSAPYLIADALSGPPAGEIIPPLRMQLDGPRGYEVFRQTGQQALSFYKDEVGLQPDAQILDIGCGVGRKTIPLLKYLNNKALYVGVDIDERSVKWCSRNITTQNPRFTFFTIDIFNKFYNPLGRIVPATLVLPFPDSSFDVVSLWSVFTHMYPEDVQRYIKEIRRVLKPGGKMVASYYLINDKAKAEMSARKAQWDVTHYLPDPKCWTVNPNIPEDLIGLEEDWLRGAYAAEQLPVAELKLGGWANNPMADVYNILNRQDIVIAVKI